jgi:hypothetical protein
VFRVLGSQVVLADRVRENLIMDSQVSIVCGEHLNLRVVLRAQAADYPEESSEQLFERARALGTAPRELGFDEVQTAVVPISDPVETDRTLDTWYEVTYEKPGLQLPELLGALPSALNFRKVV